MKKIGVIILILIFLGISLFIMNNTGFAVETSTPSRLIILSNEIPVPPPVTPSTTSSSGGSTIVTKKEFNVNRDLIEVSLKQGEIKREKVLIENTGNTALNFFINSTILDEHMVLSETIFLLNPGDVKTLNIDFFARENEKSEVYAGNIVIDSNGIKKTINVVVRVREKAPLFDIKAELVSKKIIRGDDLDMDIEIFNLGDLKNIDVLLYYSIMNFENKTLAFREESLAIENKLKVSRKIRVEPELDYGTYILYSKVSYENITATSSYTFRVTTIEDKYNIFFWTIVASIIITIFLVSAVIIRIIKIRKQNKL